MVECPYCGKSYYTVELQTVTAMYFRPIYKDGVNINPDGNITTSHCRCLNCGKPFTISTRYGKDKVSK